jgi:hypothetical protein
LQAGQLHFTAQTGERKFGFHNFFKVKNKGRELNTPCFRPRESPFQKMRQAAPGSGLVSGWLCEIRGIESVRSQKL